MATSLPTLPALPGIGGVAGENVDLQGYASQFASVAGTGINYSPVAATDSGAATTTTPVTQTSTPNTQASSIPLIGKVTGAVKSYIGIPNFTLEDTIFILLGLLLIAAGIFSFKESQTVVQTLGRAGKKAAEMSAEVAA
jgi:hypothetical protein